MNDNVASRARGLLIAAAAAALAVALAACSGNPGSSSSSTSSIAAIASTSSGGGTGTTAPSSAPATGAATAKPASSPAAASSLAGTWSGNYSGAFTGTFTLIWRQSGSRLHGTIHISNPGGTLPINGAVNGTAIQFGTVGSTAITYSGIVSGSTMSGSYQVRTPGDPAGGPWSAAKA